ncbi:hypothetical protein KAFR_0D04020 [Kazachstania africana CBS 2517]|uniref:Plasma membrane fusion protein PRM1 n=1 Tax=Kazachstania africana (strain ATCC 22294 / BCRC 22015 / CBS 2517 / CECT 1963 / NBRC 1671 / NRRL Y-8276) TaxID=1071382 RepID=H2AUK0_KAZAF|nr:hypothetical protein KAFR_0D04020 [Kazachstania africana CBS 2517]CCF58050.1 hypothetical protein KAFR_0D04020 [Kazachstania africana CBS 2517]
MATFTNYLKLGERLSQVWLNKYTLLLLLAMLKLYFFSKSLDHSLTASKNYILSNCDTIDSLYSNIKTDTPHYIALMGNYLIDKSLEEVVKASLETLSLLVYATEEILNFIIDIYLGTYACLIVSAVDGTVEVATNVTEKLISFVNTTVGTIANDLDDGLEDASEVINKVLSAVSEVESWFTDDDDDDDGSESIAHVNLTISALRNLYIPSSINTKLEELANDVPNFAEVKNLTKEMLSVPFEAVRNDIESTNVSKIIGNQTFLFVPSLDETVSNSSNTCSAHKPLIREVYSDTVASLHTLTLIFIIILAVCAVAALFPVAFSEYRLWKRLVTMRELYISKQDFFTTTDDDYSDSTTLKSVREEPYDVISSYQEAFHRWQTRVAGAFTFLITLGNRKYKGKTREKIQWFVAYISSERALMVLGIGLLALIVCGMQLALIQYMEHKVKGTSISYTYTNTSTNDYFSKDMDIWGQQINSYINSTERNINTQVFGWVEDATESVNTTINTLITEIDNTLADYFNGTLFYKPMKTVVWCVIENKLSTIEKAMTWIHEKAQIDLPKVNVTEIENSLNYQVQNPSSSVNKLVKELIQDMREGVLEILSLAHKTAMTELYIALIIIGVWLLQLPIALIIMLLKMR